VKRRNPETDTSTGVSDTGSWRSQESRLFNTGVPKCRNAKRRKSRNRHINQSFGYWEWRSQESRLFITGVSKSRNAKRRNTFISFWGSRHGASRYLITRNFGMSKCKKVKNTFWCRFRIPGVGVSKHFITRNVGIMKYRNAKNTFWCRFRMPGVGVSKHFITRNVGMPKCENTKNTFWCRFRIPGVGVSKHFTTGIECRNVDKCLVTVSGHIVEEM
jgi:hypothetical protein